MRGLNNSSKIFLAILIVISLSSNAFAAEDFSLKLDGQKVSVCPSTTVLFVTEIANTGSEQSQYTVNAAGSASKFSLTVPSGFVLNPGEKKSIYTYVTPKSTTQPGSYSVELSISTAKGLVKKAVYNVEVRDCYGVDVKTEETKDICPCELTKFDYTIINTGEFQETYILSVSGSDADKIKLSEYKVTIPAKSSKVIYAYAQNICELGRSEFTVNALGKESASATASLNVNSCFDYKVSSEKDYLSICDHSTETLGITISNDGSKSNEYTLNIEGPAWANLDKKIVVLGSGQSTSVNLILSPNYGTEGSYALNFKAVSKLGEVEAIKPVDVVVRQCNSVDIETSQKEEKICAGVEKSYEVIVRNTGEVKNNFMLSVSGSSWAKLDKQEVILEGGDEESVNLVLSPGETDISKKIIVLEASSSDSAIQDKVEINVEVIANDKCFKPTIELEDSDVDVEVEGSTSLPITITNSGIEDASYEIVYSGESSSFSQLNPSSVSVLSGKSETVYLYVAPVEGVKEGQYKGSISVKLKDGAVLDSQSVSINVKPGTIESTVEEESTIVEESTVEEETNETGTEGITGNAVQTNGNVYKYRYYIIVAVLLVIALIILIRRREKKFSVEEMEREVQKYETVKIDHSDPANKKLLTRIGILVFVAILIVLAWFYSSAIRPYAIYIVIGVVLLIVALILLKYKGSMLNFFEESEEVAQTDVKPVTPSNYVTPVKTETEHKHETKPLEKAPAKHELKPHEAEHFEKKPEIKIVEKSLQKEQEAQEKPALKEEKKPSRMKKATVKKQPEDEKKSDEEMFY